MYHFNSLINMPNKESTLNQKQIDYYPFVVDKLPVILLYSYVAVILVCLFLCMKFQPTQT